MTTDNAHIVRRLADCFAVAPVGEIVTYEMLSAAIDQDIKGKNRPMIYQAFRLLEREIGAKFITEYRKGYRRLPSSELIKIGQAARRRIRSTSRAASRGMEAGMQVANDLDSEQRNALLREQSTLSLITHLTRDKSLPDVPIDDISPLTPGQTARDFLRRIGALKE